jgi:hypothetical protein
LACISIRASALSSTTWIVGESSFGDADPVGDAFAEALLLPLLGVSPPLPVGLIAGMRPRFGSGLTSAAAPTATAAAAYAAHSLASQTGIDSASLNART